MLDRIFFILGEALVSLRRNLGMVVLSVLTTAVCLYVLGGLGLLYLGLQKGARGMTGTLEMRVYLKEATTRDQVSAILKDVRATQGVEKAILIPKENAWVKFSTENPDIAKDIENPYPDGLKIILNDLSQGDTIAAQMRARPEVEPVNGVNYLRKEQNLLEQALKLLRWVGATAGGILLLVAGEVVVVLVAHPTCAAAAESPTANQRPPPHFIANNRRPTDIPSLHARVARVKGAGPLFSC